MKTFYPSLLLATLLLFHASSFGAGDASEALCDTPGAGVTCLCSEPLTDDVEGPHTTNFNPTSSGYECGGGVSIISDSGSADSVSAAGLDNPMTVGGSGFVLEFAANAQWAVTDNTRSFTSGTYCSRHYAYYDESYVCTGTCSAEGVRYDNFGGGDTVGVAAATRNGGEWSINWDHISTTTIGGCDCGAGDPNVNGCEASSTHWSQPNPDDLTWENMDGAWSRWEICFDHDLTDQQVAAANTAYGTNIRYPGPGRVYGRMKITMVTGPESGKSRLYGPAWGEHFVSNISTGTQTWMGTSMIGAVPPSTHGAYRTVYNLAMLKTVADPTYWIGDATEVGGLPTATPTASPTVSPTATASPTATPTATPGGPTPTSSPTVSPTATPTGTPTASPTAGPPDVQCEMDFEDTDCLDTDGDTCTAYNDYNDDCVTVTRAGRRGVTVNVNCPIEGGGAKSGWTVGSLNPLVDTVSYMEMLADCADGSVKTYDFKAKMMCGGISASDEIFGLQDTTGKSAFGMVWVQSLQLAKFWCGTTNRVNNAAWQGGLECGTDYNIRFNFESDGSGTECTYYFDETASGDWGVGASLHNDGAPLVSPDTNLVIDGFFHTETSDAVDSVIDDIGDCDATISFVASGVKCGSEGPTSTPTATPTSTPASTYTPTASPTASPTQEPPANPGCRRGKC